MILWKLKIQVAVNKYKCLNYTFTVSVEAGSSKGGYLSQKYGGVGIPFSPPPPPVFKVENSSFQDLLIKYYFRVNWCL